MSQAIRSPYGTETRRDVILVYILSEISGGFSFVLFGLIVPFTVQEHQMTTAGPNPIKIQLRFLCYAGKDQLEMPKIVT